jgi:hypothetical protein
MAARFAIRNVTQLDVKNFRADVYLVDAAAVGSYQVEIAIAQALGGVSISYQSALVAGMSVDGSPGASAIAGFAVAQSGVGFDLGGVLVGTATATFMQAPSAPFSIFVGAAELLDASLNPIGFSTPGVDFVFDTSAPTLDSFSPADAAIGIAVNSNIVLTFSEPIQIGSGKIDIHSGSATGPVWESVSAGGGQLAVVGNQLSIDPTNLMVGNTHYFVTLGSDCIKDLAGNAFAGFAVHDFTTLSGTRLDLLAYSWKIHTLLSEVSVSNMTATLTTDAQGAIHFESIADPTVNLAVTRLVPPTESAATSSAVNLQDAIAILKMIVGLDVNGAGKPLSPYQSLAADFDGNGTVGLTDAIGVLKHVVGLQAPQPAWHFVNEVDASVPAKSTLNPGSPQVAIDVNLSGTSPVHVGLVGYLTGDVDGSYAGLIGALDLDTSQPSYFQNLTTATGLSLSQFGL